MVHVNSWINQCWIILEIILLKINWKFSVQSNPAKPSSPRSIFHHLSALGDMLQRTEHASNGTKSTEQQWNCRWITVARYLGTICPIYIFFKKGGAIKSLVCTSYGVSQYLFLNKKCLPIISNATLWQFIVYLHTNYL